MIEPGNAGSFPPDPGMVGDSCRNAELCRDIGGVNAAMRTVTTTAPPRRFQHG